MKKYLTVMALAITLTLPYTSGLQRQEPDKIIVVRADDSSTASSDESSAQDNGSTNDQDNGSTNDQDNDQSNGKSNGSNNGSTSDTETTVTVSGSSSLKKSNNAHKDTNKATMAEDELTGMPGSKDYKVNTAKEITQGEFTTEQAARQGVLKNEIDAREDSNLDIGGFVITLVGVLFAIYGLLFLICAIFDNVVDVGLVKLISFGLFYTIPDGMGRVESRERGKGLSSKMLYLVGIGFMAIGILLSTGLVNNLILNVRIWIYERI